LPDLLVIAKMARSVYYYWLKASSSHQIDPYQGVKERITQIFNTHQGRYGYRRVYLALRNEQQCLNHKTVQKLMGQLGLNPLFAPSVTALIKAPSVKRPPIYWSVTL
jgi:hypothetical protein